MNCPVCATELRMMERQGVEIDYCPKCRGVWLDRGELDKIIERSASAETRTEDPEQHRAPIREYEQRQYPAYERRHDPRHDPRHKKKSFLGDLFDFD